MSDKLEIRDSVQSDFFAIALLYRDAFPDEDLLPLVRDLLRDTAAIISLVGILDDQLVGHVVLTRCRVSGSDVKAALLGPLAVSTDRQGQGVGTAIVRASIRRLREEDVTLVCVLGDPAYYGRFGFVSEKHVEPPYALPAEWCDAWQSLRFDESAGSGVGKLSVSPPWRKPELWAP